MAQCEEDIMVLKSGEEKDQSSEQSDAQDQMEGKEPTQGPEVDSRDEWDTDLETDDTDQRSRLVSRRETYLQACLQTGTVPASCCLRQLGEASLHLNHYGLGPPGARAVAMALLADIHITSLELEGNFLLAEGTRSVMEMLQENCSIQSLNLSNNRLRLAGADSVSKMLLENIFIKSIKLSGNEFNDDAAKCLADALASDNVVNELDLSHNKFCETGGEQLGQMLATNEGLEVLNLSWNHLRMSGAVALCAGLKVNSTLKQLDLSWNGFGRPGAQALGQALQHNTTLLLLDLGNNHIDDEAAALLCQGLAANDTLRVLRLSHNPLTHIGALTLLTTVKKNMKSALEEINISTVWVNEAFVELLAAVCQDRSSLDVRYRGIMGSITRTKTPSAALQIFQKYFEEREESIMDFFQALDKEGTMKVSNSAFRKTVQAANIPLDQHQLEWFIKTFDKDCTGTISYSIDYECKSLKPKRKREGGAHDITNPMTSRTNESSTLTPASCDLHPHRLCQLCPPSGHGGLRLILSIQK
ncbi:leucine-rich repeat-containing protein 74A-like [Centroberyx affinis]|uniref:leucine-rich repeat-containing protein 74A-like n=1 Tax=Centroberyx affinis TaxID=166261 RepID=UPI003A5C0312